MKAWHVFLLLFWFLNCLRLNKLLTYVQNFLKECRCLMLKRIMLLAWNPILSPILFQAPIMRVWAERSELEVAQKCLPFIWSPRGPKREKLLKNSKNAVQNSVRRRRKIEQSVRLEKKKENVRK